MGIIQKQALRTTVVTFLGIGLGVISQLLIAIFLTKEEIGVLSLLNSSSSIIAVIFCLGFAQITFQVFPKFRNENNGHSGFLVFALVFSLVGSALGLFAFYLLQDLFTGVGEEYQLIRSLSYLIYPIIFFRILFRNFDVYLRMLFSSVTGAFLEGVVLRFVILLAIIIFWLDYISFEYLAIFYALALALPGFIIFGLSLLKTRSLKRPPKEIFTPEVRKNMWSFGFFGILAAASGIIILSIDQIMINQMLSTEAVGVYSVIFFAGNLVSVPSRGIKRIAVPVLTESWKNNDLKNIQTIYTKSIINQTVIGFYIFLIGWACLEPALYYLPKYNEGIYVFFFIGLAQLMDMFTGINMEIILTSKHYKVNTYFNIALAVLVIALNFIFIDLWGITGAAIASALAMLVINLARLWFLKKEYDLSPYNRKIGKLLGLGFIMLTAISFIPFEAHPILKIGIFIVSITGVYWILVFKFKLADDLSGWIKKIKNIVLKK